MKAYESPLRAEQHAQTRQRILDAVRLELEETHPDELSFAAIAARAKVAERTVYRHFPTKNELMEAFWTWWIAGPFGVQVEAPVDLDAFPGYIARLYEAYERHEAHSRALVESKVGREIRKHTRSRRLAMIESTFGTVTKKLSPGDRKIALAVFQMLFSINTWQTLRDFRGLSGPEAARAAAWMARVLIAELRANPKSLEES